MRSVLLAVASVVYDRELEPVVTFAFETGRQITDLLDSWVSGNYWGQVAVNHLRERVNMTHVILSIPAIVIAVILVGIPLNRILGWHPKLIPTPCHCDREHTGHSHACRDIVHLQRACPRKLCNAVAVRGLDLAGIA